MGRKEITMLKETTEAIFEAIKHWERLRDKKEMKHENTGRMSCALCQRFPHSNGVDENGNRVCCRADDDGLQVEICPISIKSESYDCKFTPYSTAAYAYHNFGLSNKRTLYINKEINFLYSLLDDE